MRQARGADELRMFPHETGGQSSENEPKTFPMAPAPVVEAGYRGSFEGEGFPPLEESKLMFMHIFKCAGSTLRYVRVRDTLAEEHNSL